MPDEPGEQVVRVSVDGTIATVTLHRPEQLNAFTIEMGDQLMAAIDQLDLDDGVRAIVFTGAGRAFCAGADLSGGGAIFDRGADAEFDMEQFADYGGVLARRLYRCRKPLIAAINGAAVGIGISFTLPMDVRIAADSAKIGFVFARRGMVPEACSSWFLPRVVGISQALEWVFSGRVFSAEEALRGGLVRSLHRADELLAAAHELAHELTDHSAPVGVALTRQMLWRMLEGADPAEAHELDSRGIFYLGRGGDAREGVASFVEKRPPSFPLRASSDIPPVFDDWPPAPGRESAGQRR